MRQLTALLLCAILFSGSAARMARAEEVAMLSIQEAINSGRAQGKIDGSVKFYFGAQAAPKARQSFGYFVANPKTNAFAKSEGNACTWAFLSALISLQNHARQVGGDAVVAIHSFYKQHDVSSDTQYECHKGLWMAGVALRGEVIRTGGK